MSLSSSCGFIENLYSKTISSPWSKHSCKLSFGNVDGALALSELVNALMRLSIMGRVGGKGINNPHCRFLWANQLRICFNAVSKKISGLEKSFIDFRIADLLFKPFVSGIFSFQFSRVYLQPLVLVFMSVFNLKTAVNCWNFRC